MSAWMLDNAHIDYLINFTLEYGNSETLRWYDELEPPTVTTAWYLDHIRYLTRDNCDEIGAILVAENRRSVNYRYGEHELEPIYQWTPFPVRYLPYASVHTYRKAIDCYAYQACEHPGWISSEAYRIIESMRFRAIDLLSPVDWPEGWPITDIDRHISASGAEGQRAWLDAHPEVVSR